MFAFAGGFGFVGSSLYRLYDDVRVFGWTRTVGEIAAASVVDTVIGQNGPTKFSSETPVRARHLAVVYAFTTRDDVAYKGTVISLHHSGRNVARARKRYPVGARVTVFYDANDPRRAVLERRVSLLPIFGLTSGIPLLMLARWASRKRRSTQSANNASGAEVQ